LARVWRDGQKKECFVYRFQATGTIEEKIFQRQYVSLEAVEPHLANLSDRSLRCSKQDLSACVVDAAEDTERHFSVDSLRQLFKFNEKTVCDTHDTFKCKRCREGKQLVKAPALLYGDTSRLVQQVEWLSTAALMSYLDSQLESLP
jgi:DNA repair and recombination RAD54-like protein